MSSPSTARRGVALGGFMGTGKSTVGPLVARRLGLPFVDTDAVLTRRFGPIAVQIVRDGESAFRARERAVIHALCDGVPRVIATGGGVFADATLRRALRVHHRLYSLFAPLPVLRHRVAAGAGRPLWDDGVARRALRRRSHYADVDRHVDADRTPRAVATDIARSHELSRTISVAALSRGYSVQIDADFEGLGRAVRGATGADRAIVVTDENVAPLWGASALRSLRAAGVAVDAPVVLPAGEATKTVGTWSACIDSLLARGVTRDVALVALGGGVVGDLAGFAAASTLRGLPLVQVPTTLLAMVDSSVGGKVAVDHDRGKNLIGAFYQPHGVFVALDTLRTLPLRQVRAGLVEGLKAALLVDAALVERYASQGSSLLHGPPLADLVARSISIKAQIVAEDEHERGRRALLNLGHTVGHAIERAVGYGTLLHGEAVAIGMVVEARCAERLGLCEPGVARRVQELLHALGLSFDVCDLHFSALRGALRLDKKRRGATLRLPVLVEPGYARCVDLPISALEHALEQVL